MGALVSRDNNGMDHDDDAMLTEKAFGLACVDLASHPGLPSETSSNLAWAVLLQTR
jgi:hypothetical protein